MEGLPVAVAMKWLWGCWEGVELVVDNVDIPPKGFDNPLGMELNAGDNNDAFAGPSYAPRLLWGKEEVMEFGVVGIAPILLMRGSVVLLVLLLVLEMGKYSILIN